MWKKQFWTYSIKISAFMSYFLSINFGKQCKGIELGSVFSLKLANFYSKDL